MTFAGTAYLTNAIGSGASPSTADGKQYAGETPGTTPETATGSLAAAGAPEPSGFAAILAAIAAWVALALTVWRGRRSRG